MLAENHFLAARDGVNARLIDPATESLRPLPENLNELLEAAQPHASALGCLDEFEQAATLAATPGAARLRAYPQANRVSCAWSRAWQTCSPHSDPKRAQRSAGFLESLDYRLDCRLNAPGQPRPWPGRPRFARRQGLTNRCTNSRAVSATSRQPPSIVSE